MKKKNIGILGGLAVLTIAGGCIAYLSTDESYSLVSYDKFKDLAKYSTETVKAQVTLSNPVDIGTEEESSYLYTIDHVEGEKEGQYDDLVGYSTFTLSNEAEDKSYTCTLTKQKLEIPWNIDWEASSSSFIFNKPEYDKNTTIVTYPTIEIQELGLSVESSFYSPDKETALSEAYKEYQAKAEGWNQALKDRQTTITGLTVGAMAAIDALVGFFLLRKKKETGIKVQYHS